VNTRITNQFLENVGATVNEQITLHITHLTDANLIYIFYFLDKIAKYNVSQTSKLCQNLINAINAESTIQNLPKTVFSSRSLLIDSFFNNTLPGVGISYHEVFQVFVNAGINVYISGGCIRDLLLQRERSVIDIDFSFDCDENKMMNIAAKHQWLYAKREDFPVIIIGERKKCCMQGISTKFTIDAPLQANEFPINSIYYHYNNKQLIDKTDRGFEDLFQMLIKIPMKEHEKWLQGDLMGPGYHKIFRFWKMLGRGFIPDAATQTFLMKKTEEFFKENKSQFLEQVISCIGIDYDDKLSFFKGAGMLMGKKWDNEVLKPLEQEIEKKYHLKESWWEKSTHNKLS
jgi:hypothetical protein